MAFFEFGPGRGRAAPVSRNTDVTDPTHFQAKAPPACELRIDAAVPHGGLLVVACGAAAGVPHALFDTDAMTRGKAVLSTGAEVQLYFAHKDGTSVTVVDDSASIPHGSVVANHIFAASRPSRCVTLD